MLTFWHPKWPLDADFWRPQVAATSERLSIEANRIEMKKRKMMKVKTFDKKTGEWSEVDEPHYIPFEAVSEAEYMTHKEYHPLFTDKEYADNLIDCEDVGGVFSSLERQQLIYR